MSSAASSVASSAASSVASSDTNCHKPSGTKWNTRVWIGNGELSYTQLAMCGSQTTAIATTQELS